MCNPISKILILIWGIFFVLAIMPIEARAQTNRIVCIGDSITQANFNHVSYRYELWKKLVDSGVAFELVGSIATNHLGDPVWPDYAATSFDRDHEGRWGWRADEVLAGLPAWLEGYDADFALVHIGSNDVNNNQPHASTRAEIIQIIQTLRADNPRITVLLCKLIPWNGQASEIADLNDNFIASIPAEIGTAQSPVILVDQFAGFNAVADTYDNIHPNSTGETKMAQKFYEALRPLLIGLVDEDGDGMHDQWELDYFGNLARDETGNQDGDDYSDLSEYILGSDPTNALSALNFSGNLTANSAFQLSFQTETGRLYRLELSDSLSSAGWEEFVRVNGMGDYISIIHAPLPAQRYYRIKVEWP